KQRAAQARGLVGKRDVPFEQSDAVKAAMRKDGMAAHGEGARQHYAKAKDLFLKAWDEWHPNGQVLVGAGLAAKKMGHPAEAQRLFDRAIEDLKRATGASAVQLDTPNGFEDITALAWSRDGNLLAVGDGNVVVVMDMLTHRPKYRLEGHSELVWSVAF